MTRSKYRLWLTMISAVAGMAMAGLAEAGRVPELERYEAYLLVYTGVAPQQLTPDDMKRVELFDLKYRLGAGSDGASWLEPLDDGYRFRAMGRDNDDTEFELVYREGEYFMQMERPSSGRQAEFRLYPLQRAGLEFYRQRRLGRREMLYDWLAQAEPEYVSCDRSYLQEGGELLAVGYDAGGRLLEGRDVVSQQDDQLAFTAEASEGATGAPHKVLEYALAGDPSSRFQLLMPDAKPTDYGSRHHPLGFLHRVYECVTDGKGRYLPAEPMRSWLQQRIQEQRGGDE